MATKALSGGWTESMSMTHRAAKCHQCGETLREPRRNALAAVARLRGRIRRHIRERHPVVTTED